MKVWKIFMFLFLVNSFICKTQNLKYINYAIDDGLPSSEVYDVLQDKSGYLWFATDNGVSKFNGYEFQNYSIEDGLPSKVIFKMQLDYEGKVWFIHDNFCLSYFHENKFTQYKYNKTIQSINENNYFDKTFIDGVKCNKKGDVLIRWLKKGFSLIDNQGNLICKPTLSKNIVIDYNEEFNERVIIIPTTDTVNIKKNKSFLIDDIKNKKTYAINSTDFNSNGGLRYYFDSTRYIFSIDNYLFKIEGNAMDYQVFKSGIIAIYVENDDIFLGFYNNGFSKLDKDLNPTNSMFSSLSVSSIFKDADGGFWVTSLENGVFFIPNNHLQTISTSEKTKFDKIIQTKGSEIFASADEKNIYKLDTHGKLIPFVKLPYVPYNLVYQENSNLISIYSTNANFFIKEDGRIFACKNNWSPSGLTTFNSFTALKDSTVLYITNTRLMLSSCYLENKKKSYIFREPQIIKFGERLTGLYNLNDSCVYLSSYKGIYKISVKGNDVKVKDIGADIPLLKTRINEVRYFNYNSQMVSATKDKGIIFWDTLTNSSFTINKTNGLTDNLITSLEIKDSIIWAGTKSGLNKIAFKNKYKHVYSIESYTIKNGLPTNEINDIVAKDNAIYISTNKGICFFNFNKVKPNSNPPKIYVTDFTVNEQDTALLKHYQLNHSQNSIKINYEGLAYKALGDITYKYRVIGLDSTWNYTMSREVRFPKLAPKKYKFEVMAQNEDGFWSSKPASVSFNIAPPYWARWWFKVLMGTLIILLIGAIFQYRMGELKKRSLIRIEEERKRNKIKNDEEQKRRELEKNLSKTQQKLLTQQLNPHFLFNTMSSIQYMIMSNQKMEAVGLLSKFGRMMRQGLEYSRIEYAPLIQSIEFFKNYIELKSINLKEKIHVVIDTQNITCQNGCKIPPMLIQPFIENAIIHGLSPKGENMQLKLAFHEKEKSIQCAIEDNGIGREKASRIKQVKQENHKSLGIHIINETLNIMNELHGENYKVKIIDLFNELNKPRGTKVTINFAKNNSDV